MTTAKAKTLADFRAIHDPNVTIPNKIRAALAAMRKVGPEQWEYETEFMKLAGISTTQLAQFREQFSAHVIETQHHAGRSPRKVWFADPNAAKKARGE